MLLALERLLLTRELFDYTCLINTANLFGKVPQIRLAKYRKSVCHTINVSHNSICSNGLLLEDYIWDNFSEPQNLCIKWCGKSTSAIQTI